MNIAELVDINADLLAIGITVAAIALLGCIVLFNNPKSITNKTFFYFALINVVWSISNYFEYRFDTVFATLWALRIHLFLSTWYALLFFQLAYVFPRPSVALPRWYKLIIVPFIVLTALLTLTPLVFSGITELAAPGYVTNPERGPGMALFVIMAFGLLFAGPILLFKRALRVQGIERRQMLLVFVGMIITAFLILIFNVVLPVIFNNVGFIPLAGLFLLPFIAMISYAIYRQRLFNLKVFATGILVFLLAIFTFVEVIFTSSTSLLIFRGAIFFLIIAAGVLLIRSVLREVEQREHIESLAKDLQVANAKLKEADRLKSEFLSIASHDLRAPLSTIRNFMSLLMDGTYGKLPPAAGDGIHQVFERASEMAQMVDNYLNVSRIEQGRMKYDFNYVDLKTILTETVDAFIPNATKRGIALTLSFAPGTRALPLFADGGKIRECFNNLIDNSIKYTPKGSIAIKASVEGANARVVIADTGVGMTPETMGKLFKLFSPGEFSRKINPTSTGIGLYVAKKHVEAHQGTLKAESDGEGKGSRFIIEIPLTRTPAAEHVADLAKDL